MTWLYLVVPIYYTMQKYEQITAAKNNALLTSNASEEMVMIDASHSYASGVSKSFTQPSLEVNNDNILASGSAFDASNTHSLLSFGRRLEQENLFSVSSLIDNCASVTRSLSAQRVYDDGVMRNDIPDTNLCDDGNKQNPILQRSLDHLINHCEGSVSDPGIWL